MLEMEPKLSEELLQGSRPYYFLELQVMYQFRVKPGLQVFNLVRYMFSSPLILMLVSLGKFRMAVVLKSSMNGC